METNNYVLLDDDNNDNDNDVGCFPRQNNKQHVLPQQKISPVTPTATDTSPSVTAS